VGFFAIMVKPCEPRRLVAEIERAVSARHGRQKLAG
jgi:hypothetical protein